MLIQLSYNKDIFIFNVYYIFSSTLVLQAKNQSFLPELDSKIIYLEIIF